MAAVVNELLYVLNPRRVLADDLLNVLHAIAFAAWGILMVKPQSGLARKVTHLVPLGFAFFYATMFAYNLPHMSTSPDFSVRSLIGLISSDNHVFVWAWSHYLCFDLLVGRIIADDAHRRGIPHFLIVISLLLTLFYGPCGFVFHHVVGLMY
eukprot:TRINITY_DN359_c0_g1_i1.p1 TRINITY_DN359_c0_g1~~TRINITY_DN359_c0_g1_i1.p1  ORF type:complete len:168 (+),score=35.67 TRINITY_DN359_c0_g1_i1:50-505(+)